MIKFFRKIRQKMLNDNKFGKYLIYAIGEIVLVVIGILIALQINNWSTNKSNKEYVKTYLNKVKQNIGSDLSQIDKLRLERSQTLIHCDSVLAYYEKEFITDPNIYKQGFLGIFIEKQFNQNKTAFESLKNSGYIKSIDNLDLESQINEYYILQQKLLFVERKLNDYTQMVEEKLSDKGFYIEYKDVFNSKSVDRVKFNYKSMSKYPNVESSFIRAKLFLQEILQVYSEVTMKGNEVVTYINNEG